MIYMTFDNDTVIQHPYIDSLEMFPLFVACNYSSHIFKFLASNINNQTDYGLTALHMLCDWCRSVGKVNIILKHPKIDVNIKDNAGETPLYKSVLSDDIDIVLALLNHPGIDVDSE